MSEQLQVPIECEVPDGFEPVAFRVPKDGEWFLNNDGKAQEWRGGVGPTYLILEREPEECELGICDGGRVLFNDVAAETCEAVICDVDYIHLRCLAAGSEGIHLDAQRAAKLAAVLKRFSETGQLAQPADEKPGEWQWPEWLKAPWIAMNRAGQWCAFTDEPFIQSERQSSVGGGVLLLEWEGMLAFTPPPCTDWRESKRKNPNL